MLLIVLLILNKLKHTKLNITPLIVKKLSLKLPPIARLMLILRKLKPTLLNITPLIVKILKQQELSITLKTVKK